ncbi:MAG: hypothetical protein JO131_07155 [Gammaproteobacteria bacterium]|nr:hypothetical protein [Gammaproteobacteria bacterium]
MKNLNLYNTRISLKKEKVFYTFFPNTLNLSTTVYVSIDKGKRRLEEDSPDNQPKRTRETSPDEQFESDLQQAMHESRRYTDDSRPIQTGESSRSAQVGESSGSAQGGESSGSAQVESTGGVDPIQEAHRLLEPTQEE